jgi:hypothetical protein
MFEAVDGVPIMAGAISGTGVYKKNHEVIFDENRIVLEHSVRTLTDQFGHLNYNDLLTVFDSNGLNGVYFKVERLPILLNDGDVCVIPLARVDAPEETVVILDGDPGDDPTTDPTELPTLILDGSGS